MIYFEKVSKIYSDNTKALEDINLKIEPSEFVSIVGHSGAGKTTLIKMLLAEESPSEGNVFFGSTDIHSLNKKKTNKLRRKSELFSKIFVFCLTKMFMKILLLLWRRQEKLTKILHLTFLMF
jgi:ABC-type ATPase involved in cell division